MIRKCGLCKWWEAPADSKIGSCRFNPPTPFLLGMQQGPIMGPGGQQGSRPIVHAFHPISGYDDWCGQYASREMLQ